MKFALLNFLSTIRVFAGPFNRLMVKHQNEISLVAYGTGEGQLQSLPTESKNDEIESKIENKSKNENENKNETLEFTHWTDNPVQCERLLQSLPT
jgi:hypothetical protein